MIISSMGFSLVVITTSRTGLVCNYIWICYICNLLQFLMLKILELKHLVCPIILIFSFTFLYYNAYKILRIESMGDEEFISQNDMSDKMNSLEDEK